MKQISSKSPAAHSPSWVMLFRTCKTNSAVGFLECWVSHQLVQHTLEETASFVPFLSMLLVWTSLIFDHRSNDLSCVASNTFQPSGVVLTSGYVLKLWWNLRICIFLGFKNTPQIFTFLSVPKFCYLIIKTAPCLNALIIGVTFPFILGF